MTEAALKPNPFTPALVEAFAESLDAGRSFRRSWPGVGRIYLDRPVPFLIVYRSPAKRDDEGTGRLITGEASFLLGARDRKLQAGQLSLVRGIVERLGAEFGACLLIEVWAGTGAFQATTPSSEDLPRARVFRGRVGASELWADVLRRRLAEDKRLRRHWTVEAGEGVRTHPVGVPPLISLADCRALECAYLGLEIPPLYRNPETDQIYPTVLSIMRRVVGNAIRKTVYDFAKARATRKPHNYQALGRHALVKAVWKVDEELATIAQSFDFLLAMTPTNQDQAWHAFRRHRFEKSPVFRYRPLSIDVSQAKRMLFSLQIEGIEDPTVADLMFEKQLELDRQLTILADRGSKRVLYGSLQLYGSVSDSLLHAAETLIELIPPAAREPGSVRPVRAQQIVERATEELTWIRSRAPDLAATEIEIRGDVGAGLLVSQGRLLVGARSSVAASRIEALIQHEVGTHVLTWLNGKAQRLRQLCVGLANYDEFQEGLAVLAEYLAGGLSRPRMRVLAGRVVAARSMQDGATLLESFRLLLRYGFGQETAFRIVTRAYRGGGLVKDAVYLRGLISVLDYLGSGEPLDLLYVGKIARHHVGIVKELLARRIVKPAPVLPRCLEMDGAAGRLERVRAGCQPHELLEG